MAARMLVLALCALALGGCAAPPPAGGTPPWHDGPFAWDGTRATLTQEELFRLPPDLAQRLAAPELQQLGTGQRLDALMALIFGADRKGFGYAGGHSTTAAQTWERRRGDCISLTILTYAAARALGLQAQMQEVRVPTVYERRDGFEYINRHVNVVFRVMSRSPVEEVLRPRDVVVDFEPEYATPFRGQALTDGQVLAHFHNNRGAESMAAGRRAEAYAQFRAAVAAEPSFAPAFGNLAVLYREQGLLQPAEQALRHALALDGAAEVPLRSLHDLLVAQGRDAEARPLAERLRALQDGDPYYWITRGMQHLAANEPRSAVAALERAEGLTSGFGEVHRYLALAYWRLGQRERAGEHLAQLARLDLGGHVTAKLRRKFGGGGVEPH